ncbi:hypothetical protein DL93DRAFT_2084298 [Clavulina sp. PMI_390]|nr:hypothetical protein DL93DRAFT_2084298 [Clavulina sp. PMI_390]
MPQDSNSIIPTRGKVDWSLGDFCDQVEETVSLREGSLVEVEGYSQSSNGITHRFVMLAMMPFGGSRAWIRLDRRMASVSMLKFLKASGSTLANDNASMSHNKAKLVDHATLENSRVLPSRPRLADFIRFLRILNQELTRYTIWPENCWLFCSLIHQHLVTAEFGTLSWQALSIKHRKMGQAIRDRVFRRYRAENPMNFQNNDPLSFDNGSWDPSAPPSHFHPAGLDPSSSHYNPDFPPANEHQYADWGNYDYNEGGDQYGDHQSYYDTNIPSASKRQYEHSGGYEDGYNGGGYGDSGNGDEFGEQQTYRHFGSYPANEHEFGGEYANHGNMDEYGANHDASHRHNFGGEYGAHGGGNYGDGYMGDYGEQQSYHNPDFQPEIEHQYGFEEGGNHNNGYGHEYEDQRSGFHMGASRGGWRNEY